MAREFVRAVQEVRKSTGLHPVDRIDLILETDEAGKAFIAKYEESLVQDVGATTISFAPLSTESVIIEALSFKIETRKVV
jgi:hypothetical protein